VAHLASFTCATFFRRRLIAEEGLFFNEKLKDVGDADWIVRLLRRNVSMGVLRRFTSVFTLTGDNRYTGAQARRERSELASAAPLWARRGKALIVLHHRLRRVLGGIYSQKPFSYALYLAKNPGLRTIQKVARPTAKWKP
jgi:hypothetical protein